MNEIETCFKLGVSSPFSRNTNSCNMPSFLISILFLIAVTTALADFKSEEEAISFITQEENETEENIKQLIVIVNVML